MYRRLASTQTRGQGERRRVGKVILVKHGLNGGWIRVYKARLAILGVTGERSVLGKKGCFRGIFK